MPEAPTPLRAARPDRAAVSDWRRGQRRSRRPGGEQQADAVGRAAAVFVDDPPRAACRARTSYTPGRRTWPHRETSVRLARAERRRDRATPRASATASRRSARASAGPAGRPRPAAAASGAARRAGPRAPPAPRSLRPRRRCRRRGERDAARPPARRRPGLLALERALQVDDGLGRPQGLGRQRRCPPTPPPARARITKRSLIDPGSPSAPFATTAGSPPSASTARHLRAVGNQPPPRPRRPDAASRARTSGAAGDLGGGRGSHERGILLRYGRGARRQVPAVPRRIVCCYDVDSRGTREATTGKVPALSRGRDG